MKSVVFTSDGVLSDDSENALVKRRYRFLERQKEFFNSD